MAVTSMPSISSLIKRLRLDFPAFTFREADTFSWSSDTQTITYPLHSTEETAYLLHELAHALLNHSGYDRDIQLIDMEREAWQYARDNLSSRYDAPITSETEQTALDTYRDWMHARSTCPSCGATGIEVSKRRYSCPACREQWGVNEARICALRRYSNKK